MVRIVLSMLSMFCVCRVYCDLHARQLAVTDMQDNYGARLWGEACMNCNVAGSKLFELLHLRQLGICSNMCREYLVMNCGVAAHIDVRLTNVFHVAGSQQ